MVGRSLHVVLSCLLALGLGCAAPAVGGPAAEDKTTGDDPAGAATTMLGANLYDVLREEHQGNFILGPASIAPALGIVAGGAVPDTAAGIQAGLGLDTMERDAFHDSLGGLLGQWNRVRAPNELRVVSQVFGIQAMVGKVNPDYERLLGQSYQAEVVHAEEPGPVALRDFVNGWVLGETKGNIQNLLPSLDNDTRFVWAAAAYFFGQWERPFDPCETVEVTEHGFAEVGSSVRMMEQKAFLDLTHIEDPGLQILQLPYQGGELVMDILLPDEGRSLADIEPRVAGELNTWLTEIDTPSLYGRGQVIVRLPQFEVEPSESIDIAEALSTLGFPTGADTDLLPTVLPGALPSLSFSRVFHKNTLRVDEYGSVATSATAIPGTRGGPTSFTVDRPFLFVIRHLPTSGLLFIGRITQPTPLTENIPQCESETAGG